MYYIILILILLLCGSLNAQDLGDSLSPPPPPSPRVLTNREKNDAISRLRSPAAIDRMKAAHELEASIVEDDIKRWLLGYDEVWYVDNVKNTRHIEKDLYPLYEILNCYWPPAADKLLEEIYKVEDEQFMPVFAAIIFQHKKFDFIHKEYKICTLIQDEFYIDYKERCNRSWIWPDKFKYIIANKWLKDRYLSDKEEWYEVKLIIKFFANELTKQEVDESDSTLIKMLYDAKLNNKPPEINKGSYWFGDVGRLDYSLIIAFLLEKQEWLEPLNKSLSQILVVGQIPGQPVFPALVVQNRSSEAVSMIILSLNSKINELKEKLISILINIDEYPPLELKVVIHHPWFKNLRDSEKFKEWWYENHHRLKIEEPDPWFKTINWYK